MENITRIFENTYIPEAVILFRNEVTDDFYAEACDIDETGMAVNAHPLSIDEAVALSKLLDISKERERSFLKPEGLLPEKVLYVDGEGEGFVLWYTPQAHRQLFFSERLGIHSGTAYIPALIWKATEEELRIYAIDSKGKPGINTALCYAPFFNVYEDGRVCMGTVEVETDKRSLEQFIADWEQYFLHSYFSHLVGGHNPVKGNIVQLWQQQVNTQQRFPSDSLIKTKLTVKNLIR